MSTSPLPPTSTTSNLAALQAVRTLAGGLRGGGSGSGSSSKTVTFTPECLAAAETLLNAKGVVGGDEHAARLVLQWAVVVLCGGGGGGSNQKQSTKDRAIPFQAAKEERVWQVCRLALAASSSMGSSLPMASALALLQAVAGAVFSPSMPPPTATAAVQVYAALASRGLPQVPADKVLDLVADLVERLHACHQQQKQQQQSDEAANELGALALQYLVTIQTQQTNQRKAFGVLVSRLVQPLLALHHYLQTAQQPKGVPVSSSVIALRRAIDAVLADLLFHREHLDGLRSLLAPGGGTSGSSKKRQRAAKKPETIEGGEGEATTGSPPPPSAHQQQQDKWASYQGQLLQALDTWLNGEGDDERTRKAVVMSLGHLFRLFVRRLSAVALLSVKDSLQHTPTQAPTTVGTSEQAAAVAATLGQKRKEAEMTAAFAASSSLVSRPAFALAVKLWSMLWKGAGEPASGRAWRLTAARGVLDAVLQLNVYHYDSNQTAAGQYRAIESIFLELLDGCSTEDQEGGRKHKHTTSTTETTVLQGEEVRCLATLLRIDHRVAEASLSRLLTLLARRFVVLGATTTTTTRQGEGDQQQHQQQASATNSLRQACARTMTEVVDTYARLRQNEVLLTALLSLETDAGSNNDDAAATALVGQIDVATAIGRAIRDCPPPQLVPLWDVLGSSEEGPSSLGQPGVRSKLFGLFVENLRVSSLNAAEVGKRTVATLAHLEKMVLLQLGGEEKKKKKETKTKGKKQKATMPLTDAASEDTAADGIVKVALELYVRLLDVQVTCEFWLEGSSLASTLSSSSSSSSALVKALLVDTSALSDDCKIVVDKLVIGRLRQLLHEKGVRGAEGEDAEKEGWGNEQRGLVAFLFQEETDIDLSVLGASLPLWALHCRAEHLDLLWQAVFMDSFAHVSSDESNDQQLPPSIRLLTDAAFYEIEPMAERAVLCWCRFLLDSLVPTKQKEDVVRELGGLVEQGDTEALLAITRQILLQGKDKAKKSTPAAAVILKWVIGKAATIEEGEDALARAVHGCRLLNSLPPGYLPSEATVLSFLLSVLLSRVVDSSSLLHLCLITCALRALQQQPEQVAFLLTSTAELEEWLFQTILPPVSSSPASRSVGLELFRCYYGYLVTQEEGKEAEGHVARCLEALVKQGLVAAFQTKKTKKKEKKAAEGDEVGHALRLIRVLVAPYLGHAGSSNVAGRQAVLQLVQAQLGPAVCQLLSTTSLSPELLQVSAALLELVGTASRSNSEGNKKEEKSGFVLPIDAVRRVLAKIGAPEEEEEEQDNKEGAMEFLAAYLQWGSRGDDDQEEEEDSILKEMVQLELTSSGTTYHAARVAVALAHASGGLEMQLRVLRRLEQLLDEVGKKDDGDETAGRVLARACRLFGCMVEDAGTGDGPGAEAVRHIARPFLDQVVHLLSQRLGQALSSSSSSLPGKFEGLLQGMNVLQLFAQKRWIFSTSGGVRVEDLGRLLAPLAGLAPALLGPRAVAGDEQQADKEEVFAAACRFLSALLKHQSRLVYQCAPPFLLVTRALFRALVSTQQHSHPWGPAPAKAWTRLAEHLAGHAAALRRHLMLLVTDYLTVCPHLEPDLKTRLQPAAFALMDTLTPFEVQHMHAALLDAAGQALLKNLHTQYQQRYKYRGKV